MTETKTISTSTVGIIRNILNVLGWFYNAFTLMLLVGAAHTYWDFGTIGFWQSFWTVAVIYTVGNVWNFTRNLEDGMERAIANANLKVVRKR